jgi:hypothetical protein
MSGLEIAGLAFGVLPVILEAVKSYAIIRDKVRLFRRCNCEIEDTFVEFKAIRVIFLNEVRLLLRSIQDKQQAKLDLEDCDDRRWASREFENQLSTVLEDNYDACGEVMQQTKRTLGEIATELENFDPLLSQKSPVSSEFSHTRNVR